MRYLLFDRIIAAERGRRAEATKLVNFADACLTGHYPRQPVMPGSLIVEGLAQLGGMLNFVNHGFGIEMVLALIGEVRFTGDVHPGDLIALEVCMLYDHPYGATMRGEARVGETSVARAERMVYAHDKTTDDRVIRANRERFAYVGGSLDGQGEPI
jgi:3-hydroxyacyl-[acyl-carrier-protein] dehydratase